MLGGLLRGVKGLRGWGADDEGVYIYIYITHIYTPWVEGCIYVFRDTVANANANGS